MPGLITSARLQAHRTSYSALFNRGLSGVTPLGRQFATPSPSTTRSNTYGWLGKLPKFRKWIGERRYQSIKEKAYELVNDKYSAETEIDLDDWEDDNLGQYDTLVQTWGEQAGQFDDQMIFDALKNGHQRVCYDGQNYFDTDHPYEYKDDAGITQSTIYSNVSGNDAVAPWYLMDLSHSIKPILHQVRKKPEFWMQTDPNSEYVQMHQAVPMHGLARAAAGYTFPQLAHRGTAALVAATYEVGKAAMTGFKDEDGEPGGIRPTHIFVGSSSEAAAKKLFETQYINGGDSNTYFNEVKVVVCPRLA